MESLLTLPVGDYLLVETVMKVTASLAAMMAMLLALSAIAFPITLRLPLMVGAVTLAGAAWFEFGVWQSWREAFELAGTSYCVSGHPLDEEGGVIAWSLGVPGLLLALGMARTSGKHPGHRYMGQLSAALIALALLSLVSAKTSLLILLYAGYLLCFKIPRQNNGFNEGRVTLGLWAFSAIVLGSFIRILGTSHLLPLGHEAATTLSRGEIIRSLSDLLCLLAPAMALLMKASNQVQKEVDPSYSK